MFILPIHLSYHPYVQLVKYLYVCPSLTSCTYKCVWFNITVFWGRGDPPLLSFSNGVYAPPTPFGFTPRPTHKPHTARRGVVELYPCYI